MPAQAVNIITICAGIGMQLDPIDLVVDYKSLVVVMLNEVAYLPRDCVYLALIEPRIVVVLARHGQLHIGYHAYRVVAMIIDLGQAPASDFLKLLRRQFTAPIGNDLHIHINILRRLAHRRRHPDARHGEGHARALPMLARDGQIGLPIERVIARILPLKVVRIDRNGVSFLISIRGNGFSVRACRLRFCSIMERPVEAICRAVAYRAYAVAANIRRHAIRHRVGDFKSLARQANGNRGGYVSERRLEFLAIISVVCIHLVSACRCGNAAR